MNGRFWETSIVEIKTKYPRVLSLAQGQLGLDMQSEGPEPFSDNWSYLKAELAWLDRVLLLAVARQRREKQAVERVARTPADRVTSHWWKGIIFLEEGAGYDECAKPVQREGGVKLGYQQQMQTRIQATRKQGIGLGLPTLCDRLKLSNFEKNTILLSLAPEINRRYARLYQHLQNENPGDYRDGNRAIAHPPGGASDLPTLDLALRILCRNDSEWRTARTSLTATSNLVRHRLLTLLGSPEETILARRLQLSDALVNYLLSDRPDHQILDQLLVKPVPPSPLSPYLHQQRHLQTWDDLLLPTRLLTDLQHLGQRVQWREQVDQTWGFQSTQPGTLAVLLGPQGTGKTTAAEAIAHSLGSSLTWLDLSVIPATDQLPVLQALSERSPQVLLIKSAHIWFGRATLLPQAALQQFWQRRHQQVGITLLSCPPTQPLSATWFPSCQAILEFPLPSLAIRSQLWQRAFPATTPLADDLDWHQLATWKLSGGRIRAIARDAAITAAASHQPVTMTHLLQALTRVVKSGNTRSR